VHLPGVHKPKHYIPELLISYVPSPADGLAEVRASLQAEADRAVPGVQGEIDDTHSKYGPAFFVATTNTSIEM